MDLHALWTDNGRVAYACFSGNDLAKLKWIRRKEKTKPCGALSQQFCHADCFRGDRHSNHAVRGEEAEMQCHIPALIITPLKLEGLMIHQRQRAAVKNKNQSHRRSSFKCARAFSCRPNVLSQPRMPRFSVPIRFVFSVCVSLAWCRKEVSNASCISSIIMIKFICNYAA